MKQPLSDTALALELARGCNDLLERVAKLGGEAYRHVCVACSLLEDIDVNWTTTDHKILRTWIKVAADALNEAARIMGEESGE